MKQLMQMRVQGDEPETVVLNLTGKPFEYPGAYIAKPDGSIKSLFAANVIVAIGLDTDEALIRGIAAIQRLAKFGVKSLALMYDDTFIYDYDGGAFTPREMI